MHLLFSRLPFRLPSQAKSTQNGYPQLDDLHAVGRVTGLDFQKLRASTSEELIIGLDRVKPSNAVGEGRRHTKMDRGERGGGRGGTSVQDGGWKTSE